MPLSGLRILVVEDEYLIALDAEQLLLQAGAANVTICTREQFAEQLQAQSFDALLVDTGPDRSHIEDDIARAENHGARISFTTSDNELVAGVSGHEGIQFITKPYDRRHLNALVEVIHGKMIDGEGQAGSPPPLD